MTVTERNDRKPPQRHLNLTTWPNRTGHRLGPVGPAEPLIPEAASRSVNAMEVYWGPGGKQGAADVERPGNAVGAFRVLDQCPGDTRYPRSLSGCSGVAAAQPPGGQGNQHDRVPHRTANPAHGLSACAVPADCPTGPRRRWTAGRARTP